MTSFALVNCDVYTGTKVLTDHAVVVREGQISKLRRADEVDDDDDDVEIIDLGGQSVAPGFIDLQVNGGGDVMFNDEPTTEAIDRIMAAHRRFGTTDMLPTYITGPYSGMREAATAVDEGIRSGQDGLLGIHFEGPLLNESKLGVHDTTYRRSEPDDELASILCAPRQGSVFVTLAPELDSGHFIRTLDAAGVRVAAGHTNATSEQITRAVDAGLRCGTHVWNAMSPLTSREAGAVGGLLADPRVWCDFVADGFHVCFTTLAVSLRALPRGRAFLVTDAMAPVGGTSGGYTLGSYDVTVRGGRCVTSDGTLAGSALDLATAVRNLVQKVGIPKDEALRMATLYPAEFLGIADRRGRVAPGYPAHLAIFDNEIYVSAVVYDGAYRAFG